jgi:hypothetical protein
VALFEASTGPGPRRAFFVAGAEYQLNRRGLPSLTGALLLGGGDAGLWPGLRATAAGELSWFSYRAEVAAEPYRRDALPTAPTSRSVPPSAGGGGGLEVGAAPANDFGVPPVVIRSLYAFQF